MKCELFIKTSFNSFNLFLKAIFSVFSMGVILCVYFYLGITRLTKNTFCGNLYPPCEALLMSKNGSFFHNNQNSTVALPAKVQPWMW